MPPWRLTSPSAGQLLPAPLRSVTWSRSSVASPWGCASTVFTRAFAPLDAPTGSEAPAVVVGCKADRVTVAVALALARDNESERRRSHRRELHVDSASVCRRRVFERATTMIPSTCELSAITSPT